MLRLEQLPGHDFPEMPPIWLIGHAVLRQRFVTELE
jgi:hypothetical protein